MLKRSMGYSAAVFLPHRPASRPALRPAVRPADGAKRLIWVLLGIAACLLQAAATAADPGSTDPAERRAAALEITRQRPADAVQRLADMLKDSMSSKTILN